MEDETQEIRQLRQAELNSAAAARAVLEERYGKVWSTDELREDFEVKGFAAPIVVVRRRSDNQMGSLEFQSSPRFYFNWEPDEKKAA